MTKEHDFGLATRMRSEQSDEPSTEQFEEVDHPAKATASLRVAPPDEIFGRHRMRQILSTPTTEYPELPAAISFLPLLTPDDALRQLELRARTIEAEIRRIDELLKQAAPVPRLFLLESEYLRAAQATELAWVNAVAKDLRAGVSPGARRQVAAQFSPDLARGSE